MSARGVMTIAGTIAGSYFGPVGAAIGGMIGGAIGGAIDGPVHSSQAILEDLGALKLDYGQTLPRMYGRYRVKISPIWSSEKRSIAHDEEVDAKGGPSAVNTSYTYEQDWLCWAPLNAIGPARIWRNGELIWSRLTESDAETLAASEETSAWASMTFFDGAADQMPWSVYEAAVGTENASAYRHRPTLAFESLDLGNSGQAPLIEVEFYTNGDDGAGSILLDATFEDDTSDVSEPDPQATDGPINLSQVDVAGGRLRLDLTPSGSGAVSYSGGKLGTVQDESTTIEIQGFQCGSVAGGLGGGSNWRFVIVHDASYQASFGVVVTGGTAFLTTMLLSSVGEFGGFVETHGAVQDGDYRIVFDPVSDTIKWFANDTLVRTFERGIYSQVGGIVSCSLGVSNSITGPFPQSYSYDRVQVYAGEPHGPTVEPLPVDLADIVRSEVLLEWTSEVGALTAADIDVSELEGTLVTGVAFTGSPREAIAQLMDVYYFQAVCSDKLYFRFRGGASAATIPFDDTGRGVGDAAEPFCGLERGNDIEVALQVAFTSPGLLRDYEPDTQHSDRLVGESFELRRYQSPVVFEPAEAKGRADTMVYDARIAAHTSKLSLGDEYIALEPTDVVTAIDDEGNSYRVRLEREAYADNARTFDVVLDDPNALLTSGITAETDQRAISIAPPASTELLLLDTRLLRDADDVPGHYLAMLGRGRWPGGIAYRATTETGTFERVASITTSAVAGSALTTLPDFPGGNVFDESSVVRVQVAGGTLTSSTRDAVLADSSVNAFLIGAYGRYEIVQAVHATLVSAGVYDLSGLLRGRLGTEHATGAHEVGDIVVKLQQAGMRSTQVQASEIGATRYWKGVTVGATLDDSEVQEFTAQSDRLKPDAPVDLRCSRDGTGGFAITAARRSRYAATLFSTVPLGEASEAYEVDVLDGDDVVRTLTATSFPVQYTAAQQIADFGAVQASIDVAVYQMSATVGRGYPLEGTLSTSYTPAVQSNTITLAGTFAAGVPISVYANGALIGSRNSVGGDTNLAGMATGLAAVINAHASYNASAVGSVITVTGNPGATYALTAVVGGSSAISSIVTQEAALASSGTCYVAQCFVSNLATGVTEPIPTGTIFTLTVKQGDITRRTASFTTTRESLRSDVIFGLADAVGDDSWFSDNDMFFNATSSEVGGIIGEFVGPQGDPTWGVYGGGSAPFTISVSITNPGSYPVAEDQPQIVQVTVTGTPANGEVFRVTLDGTPFTYTATVPTDTREQVIDGLVAAIDADADLMASQISSTKLEASATFIGEFSYSTSITRGVTATVA